MIRTSIATLAWISMTTHAYAQTADSSQAADGDQATAAAKENDGITDIVVTAQRRSERLSNVPIAVSAFSAETLADARISNVNDIASRTPSFTETSGSAGDPQLFIRGIGSSDDSAAGDRSVGVFVDDIYIGRGGAMLTDFFDVASVEVLRGPQGTLYGRNVVGGSVNITTTRAKLGDFDYGGEVTAGNYDLRELKAFVNVPAGEYGALRVSGSHSEHSGYARNVFTGRRVDASNTDAVRASLYVAPSDNFEITLRANYSNNDDFGQARKPAPCGPVNCQQRFDNPDLGDIAFDPDPRHVQGQTNGYFKRNLWGTSANMSWTNGIGVVNSITAFMRNNWNWQDEIGGLPDILRVKSTNSVSEKADQFSQELRLSSNNDSDWLEWTLGAYYFVEDIDRDEATDRCISSTGLSACASTNIDYAQNIISRSTAAYAEVKVKPIDALSITLGGRYSHDHKKGTLAGINLGDPIPASSSRQPWDPINVSKSWHAFTPRAVVQYNFSPAAMAYATVSKGYKAGGFQGQADNGLSSSVPFDPERVTNYEVGSKLSLFSRKLQINTAAFIMKYNDLQVRQRVQLDPNDAGSIINVVSNAANATIKGIEAEITARPIRQLDLWASGSLLDATYDDFVSGSNDYTGEYLPRTPKQAFSAGAELTLPIGDVGKLALRGEAKYKGKLYFDNDNSQAAGIEPSNTLIDASIRFTPDNAPFDVQLWAKNLTDELVREISILVGDSGFSRFNAPRTFGVTVRVRR